MTVATYEDVSVALGRPISAEAERNQVDWWLNSVELIIRSRLGVIADLDQDAVKYVEVEAVVAKIQRNGTRESSITVAVDDGTVTRRYETAVTAGDITDEWWSLLNPNIGSGSFSTRPSFEPDTARWPVSTPPICDPTWDSFT